VEKADPYPSRYTRLSSHFFIGKNKCGNWVVRDDQGLLGGLFVNRTEALKFALFENGNQPRAVIMVPEGLELEMNPPAAPAAAQHSMSLTGTSSLERIDLSVTVCCNEC